MNNVQRYFQLRQFLIEQFDKGDLSKAEYLQQNWEAVMQVRDQPFTRVDSVEKALFNYQFYNAMAKSVQKYDHTDYVEKTNYYYRKKDQATLKIIQILDFQGIDAYFIKVNSRFLKGKLFEITVEYEDYTMILHSANSSILSLLRSEGTFTEGTKRSLIDNYINQKY